MQIDGVAITDNSTAAMLPQHAAHKQAGVTFHPYGLRGDCRVAGRENFSFYGAMRGEMHTLAQMVRRLGHERRPLRVLKVDCEGCEWDAFHQLSAAHLGRLSALQPMLYRSIRHRHVDSRAHRAVKCKPIILIMSP